MKIKKDQLKKGDILFYHGNALLSRLIRRFDGSDYNHVSLYVGNNQVIEAVSQGVIVANLESSIRGQRINVKRLNNRPTDMQPVHDVANSYVGSRYAHEQLLLLLIITTTRRLRVNRFFLRLVNKLLEGAIGIILRFTNGDKEALICSELVYRSYEEVLPGVDDAYSLGLNSKHSSLENSKLNNTIESGSLLDIYYGLSNTTNVYPLKAPYVETSHIERSEGLHTTTENFNESDFEQDLEKLYLELEESYLNEDYGWTLEDGLNFKKNMDMYMSLNFDLSAKTGVLKNSKNIIDNFIRRNANCVTPADLTKAKNLIGFGVLSD